MNGYFIAAGTILILTFIVHIIAGNRTYAVLNPQRNNQTSKRLYEVWLLGRLGFQMISIDLFLSMVFTILMGTCIISYNYYLALFITILYGGYCFLWLLTLLYMREPKTIYLRLCHWFVFLIICSLMAIGLT